MWNKTLHMFILVSLWNINATSHQLLTREHKASAWDNSYMDLGNSKAPLLQEECESPRHGYEVFTVIQLGPI